MHFAQTFNFLTGKMLGAEILIGISQDHYNDHCVITISGDSLSKVNVVKLIGRNLTLTSDFCIPKKSYPT